MRQHVLRTDFNLSVKEYFADSNPLHRHNYFELIYILEGRGIHVINDNQFPYGKGDMFLLTPVDSHTFLSHEKSAFCVIDFTESFFGRNTLINRDKPAESYFFKQLEYIFQNAILFKGYIPMNEEDKLFSKILVQRLIAEWDIQVFFGEIVLQNIVFLLLNIIARYGKESITSFKGRPPNVAYEIVNYIQQNIYDNNLVSIKNIAGNFNLSKDYVSAYFKKHTGTPVKQFILDYKLELAKTRLLYSQFTISEIASELGFTDESHLNRVFKKQLGMTAKQYRIKLHNNKS
jgi:AraC family transcriptional regulator, L-rhamnose operon regulatory protein RhaS